MALVHHKPYSKKNELFGSGGPATECEQRILGVAGVVSISVAVHNLREQLEKPEFI
jgi:hypothetical protein